MPPMSSTSSRRGRRRRRRVLRRDWAELPRDTLLAVFQKLDHLDVVAVAVQVCRSWRRAACDEPALYRRIDIHGDLAHRSRHSDHPRTFFYYRFHRIGVVKAAVRRTAGQCEALWLQFVGDDRLLRFLPDQAPSLKSLHLRSCNHGITTEGFAEAIRRLPLVEDLELTFCRSLVGKELFQTIGQSCPQLKHLVRCHFPRDHQHRDDTDQEAPGIATMTELRSLEIMGNQLTMKGLVTILDSCPHLESLDISCCDVKMDNVLRERCAGFKKLMLPEDHIIQDCKLFDRSMSEDLYDADYSVSDLFSDSDSEY